MTIIAVCSTAAIPPARLSIEKHLWQVGPHVMKVVCLLSNIC